MTGLGGRLQVFAAAVCVAGGSLAALIAVASDAHLALDRVPACVALALLVLAGELRPIEVARGDVKDEITLSTGFALALTFVGGLWVAMVVMCLAVVAEDVRSGKAGIKQAFNAAQYAVSLAAAGGLFAALTGQSPLHQMHPLAMPHELPAALAAGAAFWVVNSLLTGTVTALALGEPVGRRLLEDMPFQAATNGLQLTFSPVLAVALELTVWLLPMLVLPMGAIYVSAELARRREGEALHDGLTGLANRTLFGLRVKRACAQTGTGTGPGEGCAVMLLDLDHFKEINDTLGHHVGDQLLVAVAERLTAGLRPGDSVARLGGDEFAVLAVGLTAGSDALLVGQRLLQALHEPFTVDDVRLDVEASMGIALHPDHGSQMELLLRQADIALYAAKVERGCVRLYDASHDPHTLDRLALASDLRDGLTRSELFLHHQPQIDAQTGRVTGFEALVRWQHPRHGLLMPDAFLPVVENTGLIAPLTLQVLELALQAAATWRAAGHELTVAVNLSVRHLTDLSLPQQISDRLVAAGLPPAALVLEVTETLIMTDPGRAVGVLALLRELGVGLAVDDFGTGYSSLAYLRQLHVDEIKIDKSFVLQMSTSDDNAVIVRSTIELGHNLGLRVLAEGVEDSTALHLLRTWGCDNAQGYYLGRPMPTDDVLTWLDDLPTHLGSPLPAHLAADAPPRIELTRLRLPASAPQADQTLTSRTDLLVNTRMGEPA